MQMLEEQLELHSAIESPNQLLLLLSAVRI
jgi:hypothetical protein